MDPYREPTERPTSDEIEWAKTPKRLSVEAWGAIFVAIAMGAAFVQFLLR